MSKKSISRSDIAFQELGALQEKIVFFLAEYPENHKQAIQKGIGHPADQYASVLKAVENLEKNEYIRAKEIISQKKLKIKAYTCTELGVFYALARNPNANVIKILEEYKNQVEFVKQLRPLYDVWGQEHFSMFLRDVGEFLPMVKNHGVEFAVPYLLLKIAKQMQTLDKKTKNRNVKAAMKQFPHTREMLKEFRKNIDEVL